MAIKFRVRKSIGRLEMLNEGVGSNRDQVLIAAHGDIYGYGSADLGLSVGIEHFRDLALAMMAANPDSAAKAFGEALKDGIQVERKLEPLTVTRADPKAMIDGLNEIYRRALSRTAP
jgi:hypothetical protein